METALSASDVGIAYVYCSYKDQDQCLSQLLASLSQQLAQRRPILSELLLRLYDSEPQKQKFTPSHENLRFLLKTESEFFSRTYIVVDAVDECPERDNTRSRFIQTVINSVTNLSLLVTSREIVTIGDDLGEPVKLDIAASPDDVRSYVNEQCRLGGRLKKHIQEDPDLKDKITNVIMQNFDGM